MVDKEKLSIIKIGGNVLDNPSNLKDFLERFAQVEGKKILVHGGGKIATRIGEKLGIEAKYVDGRRITDDETMDLVTMVYGGLVNKQVVSALQALGCNGIGLTGADGNIIPATKRPVKTIDYGWAGDVDPLMIRATTLKAIMETGITPVFAPLTHDLMGHMLNTNADTIASALALALSPFYQVYLMYCFEKKGVLQSVEDENSVVRRIDRPTFEAMRTTGTLHSGILPKIENALLAIEKGVARVIIGHAEDLIENLTEEVLGTIIEYKMALEAVIFDMDGTLVDSMPYHTLSWLKYFESKGIFVSPEELKEKAHGTLFDIMPRFFGDHITKEESYKLGMEKEVIYRDMYAPFMQPLDGLIEWLEALKANGLKIALGTAADFSNTDFTLDTLQIRKYFDVIVTSDIVHEGKPSPAVYNFAAKELGVPNQHCLVFEDTYIGVKAGKLAGMKVAAITTTHPHQEWEGHGVDFIFDSYREAEFEKVTKLFS